MYILSISLKVYQIPDCIQPCPWPNAVSSAGSIPTGAVLRRGGGDSMPWNSVCTWAFGQHQDLHQAQHEGHSLCKWRTWNLSLEPKWMIVFRIEVSHPGQALPLHCGCAAPVLGMQRPQSDVVKHRPQSRAAWSRSRAGQWHGPVTSLLGVSASSAVQWESRPIQF